ncbi:tRNA pseudouridine(13) synthase TruD [Streptomyces sp. NPDC050658]|uniref:tRNA pseudouridine(13) synthase TruD n=1 Tax=unclassified Streptomyces TaxID=2593676 RepID=UPI003424224A
MFEGPVLKHVPEDFLVRESMVVQLSDESTASHQYLVLRKRGYTTTEAVRIIADWLSISPREVSYGGLKDEDGVTEQLVSVPAGTFSAPSGAFAPGAQEANLWPSGEGSRWIHLQQYGHGSEPLRIGRLEGNGFRIIVRNLDAESAKFLESMRKVNFFFLNYYGVQRFGVPGGPKRTHRVGAAILDKEWGKALQELAELGAPESRMAQEWCGSAQGFFAEIDPRTTSFYLASLASSQWNEQLKESVSRACPMGTIPVEVEGVSYRYVSSTDAVIKMLGAGSELPYTRYTYEDGSPVSQVSMRPSAVQTVISMGTHKPDERIPGAYQIGLRFFLPSGSYATTAVDQFLTSYCSQADRTEDG